MGVWKIYHKDGTILKDANGNNIDIRSLEYSDAWMGECYLTVTFRHETPIVFMMGDYIIYRNEKFVLNYEPGKDKKERFNTYGDGFVYDSVKFNSLQNELSDAEFLDVVLNDNELHYTALPKFQFYVETLDDLLDRIQANLNEQIGAGKWKIFSRNKDRSEQRGCTADEWNEAYGEGTNNNIIDSVSITADTMTCWDALALVNSKWNVNFIVRGRNVYVGTAGVTTEHMFEYGRGNGLYEIEQNADSDQKVITRLRAYGSEKNLPSHYYADLGVKYVANITKVVEASTHVELELDLDYIETYFRNKRKYVVSGESQEQSFGWVLQVTFDFQTVITGYVTQVYNSNKCKFYSELRGTQTDTGDEESKEKLDAFIAQVNSGKTKMYITSGLNKKNVPSSMKEYAENLPNNMSINRLMLPGFPHVSLSDFYESLTDEEKKYVNPTGKQHRFSTDPHRPYIDSVNIGQIGLHSASQFFDTDDKTNGIIEIYPTIEEMVIGGVRVDEIDEGVAPDDDGRYDGDHSPNNVDIYLSRAIDFDIKDLADDDFSISMKDGRCGGRTFKVASSTKVDGRWRLTIERTKDDALDLWFPYRDYPIRKGDHFVLTDITLPDSYVNAASLKLLKYAIALLEKNDYTRYVYQPKVDEIFMARQHDAAMADKTGAIKSLHDTLKAGDLMDFRDDDLNISGTITIDQLNIKEQDGKIPTYEITLREDKEVGTIQKIQQQITSLENGNGGSVGGGGITLTQVKGQVATEGSKFFLSKLTDDTANGKITFIKGLIAKGLADLMMGAKFGNNAMITELGEAFFSAIKSLDYDNAAEQGFSVEKEKNGKYHAFFTNLTIWGKAIFHELEIRKLSYSGGNIYLSGAGSKIIKVVPVKQSVSADGVTSWVETTENDVERFGWKCYLLADNGTTATMNYWHEGDQARCQTMGEIAAGGAYSDVSNKSYWRTIPNGGVSTQNEKIYGTKTETYLDEDGNEQTREVQVELYDGQAFAWIVISKHCDDIDGYDDEFSVGYDGTNPAPLETRDIPSAGDTIVLDGNRHRNKQGEYDKTDRQNVIILETTGEYAPRIACYANITEYKHTFTKNVNGSDKEVSLSVFETSPKGGTKINSSRFEWISDDGSTINIINYRGDWAEENTYHKNDQVNHNNAVWVCVANSGVGVQEEPSDGATYWKKVLSGGKGEKGDKGEDAVSYTVTLTRGSNGITQGLYVGVTRYIGTACTTGTIIDFGMSCKAYTDGTLAVGLTDRLQTSDNYIDFAAFPKAKSFTVELLDRNGNKVATGNYSSGDDAISILVEDAPLVFDTDDNGIVSPSVTKTAKVKVMRGNTNVADDCTQLSSRDDLSSNCKCSVTQNNGYIEVSVSGGHIVKNDVVIDGVNKGTVSTTSGYAVAQFVYDSVVYFAQVPFSVNVAKFTGSVAFDNKRYKAQFDELSNGGGAATKNDLTQATSKFEQTAREISLSVSEKSIGRRNLLVGSAFNRQEGFGLNLDANVRGYGILMNDGVNGMNCIKVASYYDGTRYQYCGAFWGGNYTKNIRIKHGTKYTFSCWVKVLDANTTVYLEVIYNKAEIGNDRDGRPTGTYLFAIKEPNKWQLVKWSFTTDDTHDWIEANVFTISDVAYKTFVASFCKPMLAEGDYNGWTLSEQDYDYVGGNLLDNARTLDKSGTLVVINDTVIQNGYGTDSACAKSLMKANATLSDYKEVLKWIFGSTYLVNGNDYIFSFVAKADVDDARVVCYMWSGDIENSCDIFTEGNGGAWDSRSDGNVVFILSRQWTRYWVHWRPNDGYATPKEVIIRHTGNNSTSASTVYVTQPKLEIGATMTEWTERKTDLVDKASLKEAGILVDAESVTLYGNQVHIKKNKTDANDTVLIDNETGKVSAGLINADEVVAKGIKTQELEAQHLKVTGNSRLGIFEIHTAAGDKRDEYTVNGDSIKYSGSYKFPDGKTEASGAGSFLTYKPMFIRQGAPDGYEYMRLGHQFTEWDDGNIGGGSKNYFFAGAAARYVCSGDEFSCNRNALPVALKYKYNSDIKPAAYVYSVLAKDSAAFAIYTQAVGTAGERLAIQTNGAIRGVEALNVETIYISKQISSGIGAARCVNTAEITINLPIGPVVGQKFYVLQEGTGKVNITGDSDHQIIMFNKSIVTTCNSNTKGQISIFIWSGKYWFGSFLTGVL